MNKIFSFIPNLYFFPFIFAFNTWKSKKTFVNKILLLCLDLFIFTPLWITGWSLFFFLVVVVFYILDYIFHKDFNSQSTGNLIVLSFIFFGFIIPAIYIIKPVIYKAQYLFKIQRFKKIFLILLPLFAVYIVITQLIIDSKQITGNAMYPALKNGDMILIKKYDKNYQRGDIIIFKSLKNPDLEFISRLIALPKDKIKIQQGNVYLNGKFLQEPYTTTTTTNLWQDGFVKEGEEYIIPDNEVFVMGDNRLQSSDSREFGFVDTSSIIGKYAYRYLKRTN